MFRSSGEARHHLCVAPRAPTAAPGRASAMASTIVNPHEKMLSRDVNKVARGEQAPRPPHEPGSVAESPPPPPEGATIELRTAPCDFRFPTQNQTRHCYVRYLEYHRCMKAKDDKSECEKFQRYYRSLCPTDWVVEWNMQMEEGIFPGPSDTSGRRCVCFDPPEYCPVNLLL